MSANLIHKYCDGEMEPSEAAVLERRMAADSELRAQVDFQRRLRERVSGAMTGAAPEGLADRIRTALAQDRMKLARQPRTPRRVSLLAVAATIALVAGAVLYGIFGPRLDDQQIRPSDLVVDEVYQWAAAEHGRCAADDDALGTKITYDTRDATEAGIGAWLGVDAVPVFDLSEPGYEFVGGGHCMVPGPTNSGHLVYRRTVQSDHAPLVSLFVVPDIGQFEIPSERALAPGEWRESGFIEGCDVKALQGTDGTLAYLLVCCDERDLGAVSQTITRQIGR